MRILIRGWNQFEVNETLFGVKSTFNEELYTTKLERGPQMRDLEREALRIAREIEGEETHDLHLAEVRTVAFLLLKQFFFLLIYFSQPPILFSFSCCRKEELHFTETLKLMRKLDIHQSLGGLMIVVVMIVRTFCWIHAMMKHSKMSLVQSW